ncbi:spore germination protein [Clostridiaceae bacterium UIB06]|uniref:Spore germination protein n=1 Tax=Clostridium thailandense TaxID=2794346 RepID=A0A949TXM6_9CLOT|nr:spore germination protein [Clostridium thailandense]MBV7272369.1 spore germination protein [Clostridium thailandense]MCH5135918.1 spore germination protein [Clostridiaceae bacterium UIB06]
MKEELRDEISLKAEENLSYIKDLLKDSTDIVFREFYIGKLKAALVYVDGMADKNLLDNYVLETLMVIGAEIDEVEKIKDKILTVSDMREEEKLSKGINSMLSGDTIMLIDGLEVCYVIATRLWPARGVSEPSGETVIRGGRDGFTETIRFNTALVRRRIKDSRLKVQSKTLGARSKSDVAIMYIEDIVNKEALKELLQRLEKIDIDAILDSGYVEQFIEDNKVSVFPQVQSTERPDVVASALYEGRIAILVDNSPFALIVPTTMAAMFQSPDDYYQRWIYGSTIRIIRFFSIFASLMLPALYVAVTSFHPAIIPTKLAYFIASSREGVPFPAFVEALIMEVSLAFLIESTARLPKAIGSTIGIVGGLIIGQAAVSAGIVSPIMIIIVSVTAITSFTTPNYEMASAFRILRFILIIMASIIGLYGIMLGLIITLIHLVRLKSFNVPYLSPLVNPEISDFKDLFIRFPIRFYKKRPEFMNTGDKVRQK